MPTTEQRSRDFTPTRQGLNVFVDGTDGSNLNGGLYPAQAFKTITAALAAIAIHVAAGRRVSGLHVAPGDYAENVVIPRSVENLVVYGQGSPGSVSVVSQGANSTAITVHGRDVRLENIGGAGTGTGAGIRVTGRRFSADSRCKFENQDSTGAAAILGPGLVADIDAATADKGDFGLWEGVEFCYAAKGVIFQGSDYGASGQHVLRGCRTHNVSDAHFEEQHLAGGANNLHFRDLLIEDHKFMPNEDGTFATKFASLNDDNANSGVVTGAVVPVALDVGANPGQSLVSTALKWVGNKHPAGLSSGQPS